MKTPFVVHILIGNDYLFNSFFSKEVITEEEKTKIKQMGLCMSLISIITFFTEITQTQNDLPLFKRNYFLIYKKTNGTQN